MTSSGGWFAVQLPLAEATMLTSTAGPFFGRHGHKLPGEWHNRGGGLVEMDAIALRSLQTVTDDFAVTEVDIGVYEMRIGRDAPYPVLPVGSEQQARR